MKDNGTSSTARDPEIRPAPMEVGSEHGDPEKIAPDHDVQRGVQQIEAVTLTWTKTSLAAILIWFVAALGSICVSSLVLG